MFKDISRFDGNIDYKILTIHLYLTQIMSMLLDDKEFDKEHEFFLKEMIDNFPELEPIVDNIISIKIERSEVKSQRKDIYWIDDTESL